jgi:alcohol dehydrogenase YqhD (iron-dependent ADH family)
MLDFDYNIPTRILFGRGRAAFIGDEIKKYGRRVLLVYGSGSIKKNGVYRDVAKALKEAGIYFKELPGVVPNPRLSSVRRGIDFCRKDNLDFVLAAGGGSVIDCAKAIAFGFYYNGDVWDFFIKKIPVNKALPLASVLTLAATGSEMNGFAVISNDETKEKLPAGGDLSRPRFSVLDPTYTFTVSGSQTAAGVVDIFVHVLEQYFSHQPEAFLQDRLSEAVLATCIHYGPQAIRNPADYESRANLMWAGSLALNGLLSYGKVGDWATHYIEHAVSALYDVTHGAGLAVILPAWMRYVLDKRTSPKLALYARRVWSVTAEDDHDAAREGIKKTEDFFVSLGMPAGLNELGVDKTTCKEMARKATIFGDIGNFRKLSAADVEKILIDVC